jgi:acetylornithine deacetylase/succinyl-diaminopimelate desuccinylase-like protein
VSLQAALERARSERNGDLADFLTELRIASVAMEPSGRDAALTNADWLAERFRESGFQTDLWGAEHGMPVIVAEWRGAGPDAPTVTIYGHYDVQPADPLELWTSPPFEPEIRDGRIYARGVSDNKGNHFPALCAAAHAIAAGGPPVNLRFLIEGEEEGGGPVLPRYLRDHGREQHSDVVLIWDGGFVFDAPGLVTGVRGILYVELHARGPRVDLHSGEFGGVAPNPINTLARVIAGLKDGDGRITIPGFYDAVEPPSEEERREWASWGDVDSVFAGAIGAAALEGEHGWSVAERLQARPTLDCHGVWGGFSGTGEKTVIPAEAGAKLSMRLVPGQQPDTIFEALAQRVDELRTPGVTIEAVKSRALSPAVSFGTDHAGVRAASAAFKEAFGREVVRIRAGYSIPVAFDFVQQVGAPVVCSGFPQFDASPHSPNENMLVDHFHRGIEMLLHFFWRFPEELRA